MYVAGMELKSFSLIPVNRRVNCLQFMLNSLAEINRQWLIENPGTPWIYQALPRYSVKRRPPVLFEIAPGAMASFKIDRWQDIPRTIELKEGDCKDFAAWRVAELRNYGVADVGFYVKSIMIKDLIIYHILVRTGVILEDPSANLGMPQSVPYEMLKQ
jgi:hypothetical protein